MHDRPSTTALSSRRTGGRWRVGAAIVAVAVVLAGCSQNHASTGATTTSTGPAPTRGVYAGKVVDSDAYVGLVVSPGGTALAYVVDRGYGVDWLSGRVNDGAAVLTNDGGAVAEVALGPDAASGTFARGGGGERRIFRASVVAGPAGLYRAVDNRSDGRYVGGWIVLPDGSQRGAVRRYETPLAPGEVDASLDLKHPTIAIPGGSLTPTRVTPTDDLSI